MNNDELQRKRAENAEAIMQKLSREINQIKSGERDDSTNAITPGQRDMGYHEIFPYGADTWARGEE